MKLVDLVEPWDMASWSWDRDGGRDEVDEGVVNYLEGKGGREGRVMIPESGAQKRCALLVVCCAS